MCDLATLDRNRPRRYWEVVECARRLALTSLTVFLAPGTVLQVALSLLISIICIKAWSYTAPCKSLILFRLKSLGYCAALCSLTCLPLCLPDAYWTDVSDAADILAECGQW